MTQSDFGTIDPNTKSGSALATDLNAFRNALNTHHAGVTRPAYAQQGTLWLDMAVGGRMNMKWYDGSNDVSIGYIDTAADKYICDIKGGTVVGITDLAVADGGTGASTASDARDNLGLGAGNSVTFQQIVISGSTNAQIFLDAAATTNISGVYFRKTGLSRWVFYVNSDAESGSNTGSTLRLHRYSDAGANLATQWTIDRSSGAMIQYGSFTVSGGVADTSLDGYRLMFYRAGASVIDASNAAGELAIRRDGSNKIYLESGGQVVFCGGTAPVNPTSGTTNGWGMSTSDWFAGSRSGNPCLYLQRTTSTGTIVVFYSGASNAGNISVTASTVTVNNSSDRRRKKNIRDMVQADTEWFFDDIQPKQFEWDIPEDTLDSPTEAFGFIADEFQQVLPQAVDGEPDAVDEEGTPIYQTMAYSHPEVMTMLLAEMKFLRARVADLEAAVGI